MPWYVFFAFLSFCLCSISRSPFYLCSLSPSMFCFFLIFHLVSALSQSLPLLVSYPLLLLLRLGIVACSASLCLFSLILSLLLSVCTNVSILDSFPSLILLCLCAAPDLSSSTDTFFIRKGRGLCKCKSAQKVTKIIRMALRVISWQTSEGRLLGAGCGGGGGWLKRAFCEPISLTVSLREPIIS